MMRPPLFTLALVLLIPLIHLYPSYAQEAKPFRDPIVIRVIHLDYADAEYLASVLAPLLSMDGRVVAYRPTNSLIIKDRASLVKTLVKIIKGDPDP
ncbi:MAG: hypothetical protein HWN70_13540 [Desulfobacterales bacterium]|nr:hypothetical protein [Desulfobacterales bacterium]